MNERERVEMIMRCYNLTPSQFADKSGIQRASVSHILSGRNKLSLDIVLKIHDSFPSVDLEWLMTGSGTAPTEHQNSVAQAEESTLFTLPEATKYEPNNLLQHPVEHVTKVAAQPQAIKQQAVRTTRKTSANRSTSTPVDNGKRIKEVRIFYTDGTYETLIPEK